MSKKMKEKGSSSENASSKLDNKTHEGKKITTSVLIKHTDYVITKEDYTGGCLVLVLRLMTTYAK